MAFFELLPPLIEALPVTVGIFAGGAVVAVCAAFLAGIGRSSPDPVVRVVCGVYIETFRGTSALVQLYWFFFALPLLLGIRLNAILVGIVVLGLNIGAYGAEVVGSAIAAVPQGQILAATALNMTRWQTARHVVLPQALPMMIPPFGNLMIELLKSTALVSLITGVDLTQAALFIRDDTFRTIEVFVLLLAIYFALSLAITFAVRRLERTFDWTAMDRRPR